MHLTLLVILFIFIIYRIASAFISAKDFKHFSERKGCRKPLDVSGSFPYGWARLRRLLNMAKSGEDLFDDILGSDLKDASTIKWTEFDGNEMMHTIEPENLKAMLATQFEDFEAGSRRYDCLKPLIGRSIFSSDGSFWQHSRSMFRPQFSRENINDLEMTERASQDLIHALGETEPNGWTDGRTEMMPLLLNFTLDTATHFLFGESVDSQRAATAVRLGQGEDVVLEAKHAEAMAFSNAFAIVSDTLVSRIRFQALWWLGDGIAFRKALRVVKAFTEHFVQLVMESAPYKQEGKKLSLMSNLATQTQNREELRNQTLAILFAGRDTTSALLGWCIARLALHHNVFDRLRNAILEDFDSDDELTFSQLKSCKYLQYFLNEVLRLHPTIPLNQRIATRDTTLPVGGGPHQTSPIAIRKGQVVMFSVYLMHRRKDLWGPDALNFRPERWEGKVQSWQYLPFLGGPRVCLGQQFALTEASYVLVRLLQEFDAIEPVTKTEMSKLKKSLAVTMYPEEARVRFRKARK